MMCSSLHSIVPCLFEVILMPESSLQECYMMLICWNCYNLMICYFCCILCVHPMSMSSTCVLNYVMPYLQACHPCIFVSCIVSASSLLSRVLVVAVLLGWICYIMMLCKPAATSHSMHNLEMFTKDDLLYMSWSIHSMPTVTCCFVFFVAFCVCILWAWCLHEFWATSCHLHSCAIHVFLWVL